MGTSTLSRPEGMAAEKSSPLVHKWNRELALCGLDAYTVGGCGCDGGTRPKFNQVT